MKWLSIGSRVDLIGEYDHALRVGYHPPEGSAGGSIIIHIDKQSGEATWLHMGQ